MKTRFVHWAESHRDQLSDVLVFALGLLSMLMTLVVRTLFSAGAILLYFFFTATPDTTVYQLAQVPHKPFFWQVAFCIAIFYSVVSYVFNGGARCGAPPVAAATMARGASSLKSPQ